MNSTFTKILRTILALGLIFYGLSKFVTFDFMPTPNLPEEASNFMGSLGATGYVLPIVGGLEILIGVLLLINKWTSFALLLLVPITVNILLFHLFLDTTGILIALVIALINIVLIYKHWKAYRPLFVN